MRRLVIVLWCAAATLPTAGAAQILRITPRSGEVGIESRAVESASGNRSAVWEQFVSTWVNIPISGSIVSPSLFNYHAAFRPTRTDQSLSELSALGISVGANLLSSFPVSLSVHADRTTAGTRHEGLGANIKSRNSTSGGVFRVRMPAFPVRLEWNSRDLADTWRASLEQVPILRDESFDVLRLTGESSKLSASLERQRFTDRVGTLGFSSIMGTAVHTLRWGTGSSLISSIEMRGRDGRDQQQSQLVAERLHVRHSQTVASDLSVHRQHSSSHGDYVSDVATTMLSVQSEPKSWLSAAMAGAYSANVFRNGRQGTASAVPSVTVRQWLPGKVRLVGTVGASYQRTEQHLTDELPIPVTDESHTVTTGRQIQLQHERADARTVVVFNRDRTVMYLEGTDYRVVALGDLLRVEIPIVSRITVGDELLLTYFYAAPAAPAHDLQSASSSVSLARGGVSLSQSAALRHTRVLAGDKAMALEGGEDYVTALDVRRDIGGGHANVTAAQRYRRRARSDFTLSDLRVGYAPRVVAELQSSLGASFSRSSASAQVATVWGTNVSVARMLRPQLHLVATAESQLWTLANRSSDRTLMLNLDVRWSVGQVETESGYLWQQRSTLEQRSQHRLSFRLKRRF